MADEGTPLLPIGINNSEEPAKKVSFWQKVSSVFDPKPKPSTVISQQYVRPPPPKKAPDPVPTAGLSSDILWMEPYDLSRGLTGYKIVCIRDESDPDPKKWQWITNVWYLVTLHVPWDRAVIVTDEGKLLYDYRQDWRPSVPCFDPRVEYRDRFKGADMKCCTNICQVLGVQPFGEICNVTRSLRGYLEGTHNLRSRYGGSMVFMWEVGAWHTVNTHDLVSCKRGLHFFLSSYRSAMHYSLNYMSPPISQWGTVPVILKRMTVPRNRIAALLFERIIGEEDNDNVRHFADEIPSHPSIAAIRLQVHMHDFTAPGSEPFMSSSAPKSISVQARIVDTLVIHPATKSDKDTVGESQAGPAVQQMVVSLSTQ